MVILARNGPAGDRSRTGSTSLHSVSRFTWPNTSIFHSLPFSATSASQAHCNASFTQSLWFRDTHCCILLCNRRRLVPGNKCQGVSRCKLLLHLSGWLGLLRLRAA